MIDFGLTYQNMRLARSLSDIDLKTSLHGTSGWAISRTTYRSLEGPTMLDRTFRPYEPDQLLLLPRRWGVAAEGPPGLLRLGCGHRTG